MVSYSSELGVCDLDKRSAVSPSPADLGSVEKGKKGRGARREVSAYFFDGTDFIIERRGKEVR